MKYGKLAARSPLGLSPLHALVTLPAARAVWGGPNDHAFDYRMLGNDRFGDCTFAGFVHAVQAICLLLHVHPPEPGTDQVTQAYFVFTHGVDSGCVEADVLHALYVTGILGIDLVGYVQSTKGLSEVLQVTQTFGAAYLGIQVPATMGQQFNDILANHGGVLDLTGTDADNNIVGGHCIDSIGFNQNTERVGILSWGHRVQVTFRWLERYMDEAWALIPRQVKTAGVLDGFNWAQLDADLKSIGPAIG